MRPRHVLLTTLVLAFTALPTTGAHGATRVVHWSPFAGDGSLRSGLVATPRFNGDCWTGSFVLHGGFRCMTGHRIYDPCFEDPLRDGVVCVADPFARGVIRLRVTGDLSDDGSARPGTVWAVRLRSGARCTFLAGGATNVDGGGRRLNFFCRRSSVVLWGNPRRTTRTWTIRASRGNHPEAERRVAIRTAFIGAS